MLRRGPSPIRVGRRSWPSREYAVLLATLALGVALSALAVGRRLSIFMGMLVG